MAELDFVNPFPHNHSVGEIDEVLTDVVGELNAQRDSLATPLRRTFRGHPLPSRSEIFKVVELLRSVIFPGYFGNRDVTEESLGLPHGRHPSPGLADHGRRGPPRPVFRLQQRQRRPDPVRLPHPRQTDHRRVPQTAARTQTIARPRRRRGLRGRPGGARSHPRRSSAIPGFSP